MLYQIFIKLHTLKNKTQHDYCCSLSYIHWCHPSIKGLPISHSSLAHPPHRILTGRAFEIHSHLIQQWTWTMHWDTSSVPWVPSRVDVCLTLHSQISCGIKQFMWLSSGAGFNLWNLVLFGNQCFGGLPKLTEEKIKSPVDCHWVWVKSSGTISPLTLPLLQKLGSALATSSQIQAMFSARHYWEHLQHTRSIRKGPQVLTFKACQKSRIVVATFTCRVCYTTFLLSIAWTKLINTNAASTWRWKG